MMTTASMTLMKVIHWMRPGQGHEPGADHRGDGHRTQEGVVQDAEDGVAEVVEDVGAGQLGGQCQAAEHRQDGDAAGYGVVLEDRDHLGVSPMRD